MDIKTFKEISSNLPPHIAILIRAQTGIGKSAIVSQIAEDEGLPLIDVRGSTMSEGDLGYPDIDGMKQKGIMTFCMPSWFVRACNEPVVLFLDEFNRGLPAVQQSFFQIVLDRQLGNDENGNPYNIHPETRIFAAINHGNEYDVNEMDPALLRRFWAIDLKPTKSDWISWAKSKNVDNLIIEFLKTRSAHLYVNLEKIKPGNVFPTPASWARFDEVLKFNGVNLFEAKDNFDIFNTAIGFIGQEAAVEFTDFVKKYEIVVTPEELLKSFRACQEKIKSMSNDRINSLIERLGEHSGSNDWTVSEAKNAARLGKMVSEEMMIHFWSCVTKAKNINSIQTFHKEIGEYVVEVVNSNRDLLNQ
tara:strand:+ start:140 stop:1219 length:1080 start_codon:yes stop_codon:yes gene_type:complete